MSKQLIQEYFNDIDRLRKFSGTTTENVIRGAFRDLLKSWSRQKNLHFLDEYEFESAQRTRIRPDGTIKHDLRLDLGYWEAKDIDLIARVTRVSVETVAITEAMKEAKR